MWIVAVVAAAVALAVSAARQRASPPLELGHNTTMVCGGCSGEFAGYAYDRAIACVRAAGGAARDEADVELALAAGVVGLPPPDSAAAWAVRNVSRLPFVEHWLRTGDAVWQASAITSALRVVGLAHQHARPRAGRPARILEAGCGTGAGRGLAPGAEVVCLEYVGWVHELGRRVARRGDLVDTRGAPGAPSPQRRGE
eukprot:gene38930-36078_t